MKVFVLHLCLVVLNCIETLPQSVLISVWADFFLLTARVSCFCFGQSTFNFIFKDTTKVIIIIYHEFVCTSVYTAVSFCLNQEVTSTSCLVNLVQSSHTPLGSRDPYSVWSRATPWLIYFLPRSTTVCGQVNVCKACCKA